MIKQCGICGRWGDAGDLISECIGCERVMCGGCQSGIEPCHCREREAREVNRALLACHRRINSIFLVDESKKEEMGFPMGPAIRAELESEAK